MKKLLSLTSAAFILLCFNQGIKAQNEVAATGTPEANFSIYKNKLKKSEAQLSDEKKTASPKFWLSRAELMMDIFELNREFLQPGTQQIHVNLIYPNPKEKKTWQDDEGNQYEELIYDKITIKMKNGVVDNFVETVVLYDDPLPEAFRCLEKTQEIDSLHKLDKKVKDDYNRLKMDFQRLGIEEYYKPDYAGSFKAFAAVGTINEKPVMESVVDTTLLFYAGMAASRADMNDEAIEYYEKAAKYNYPEPDLYVSLKLKYMEAGDTLKALNILEKGFKMFPSNQMILRELINYYLLAHKAEEAMEYLKLAQAEDPKNLSYISAEGSLYDQMGDQEKALATYQKCIDMDSTFFDAYYNIGVIYYNKAYQMYKDAESIRIAKDYGAAVDAADVVLTKALPYMEKAHQIDPKDRSTIETLKTLYYRMQMNDKYEEMKALLEALPPREPEGGIK
jgi:tetratricopeptide (TPR) repeat protein